MGGDDSQKLLPWRGIHSSPGRKPPAQLRINNVTETAGWNLALPPPSLAGLAVASATGRLGHFWKAHSGQFWRAPKAGLALYYSRPSIRAEKTHEANERAAMHLKEAFGQRSIGDITADDIEHYLRRRLQARVQIRTTAGVIRSFNEIGLSRQPSIRNCGCFAV